MSAEAVASNASLNGEFTGVMSVDVHDGATARGCSSVFTSQFWSVK